MKPKDREWNSRHWKIWQWRIGKTLLPFFKSATPKTDVSFWSLAFGSSSSSLLFCTSASAFIVSLSASSSFLLLSWRPLLCPINNTVQRQMDCRKTQKGQKEGTHPETQDLSLYLIFSLWKSWNVNKLSKITVMAFGIFELTWVL